MKILHTGDWHLGKLVHNLHMTKDQKHVLLQLFSLIKKEKPDVIIIAGDLYDRSVPPTEAVDLLDEVLTEIVINQKTKVIIIAGNHDSPGRVGFAKKMLSDNGLFMIGNLTKEITPIPIQDTFGTVNFYPIPFAEPIVVRELKKDDSIISHDDAMKAILEPITTNFPKNSRNVCIAHAFIMGTATLETSESERPLSVGGSENVNVDYFKDFNYVALGHLHQPQKVKYDHIRYAGSLLKYSFSEARQKKSVTIIEMDKDGGLTVDQHHLEPQRDMRIIKGELQDLLNKNTYSETNTDDYIMAVLSDQGALVDPMASLRAVYPNILRLEKEDYERAAGENKTSASGRFTEKNSLELFEEFYENISGENFDKEKSEVVEKIIEKTNRTARNS